MERTGDTFTILVTGKILAEAGAATGVMER
jgi:hypothetical protein